MTFTSKATDKDWKYKRPAKSNAQGHMKAGAHRIYWHEYGNPKGEPVLFVHGGPGGGSSPEAARYFNPKRYRIVLFDQRGCGKSTPHAARDIEAALADNTTGHLIADMEALRAHLGITGKMHVFGGSWGSTLSLAYAILHPKHVATLILRGIFLGRKADIDYFYQGNAARYHADPQDASLPGTYLTFPEAWKAFVTVIPPKERHDMVAAYARIFAASPKGQQARRKQDKAALAWSAWEGATSFLAADAGDAKQFGKPAFARAFARIENHYFMNGAFFTGAGEAARDNNYLLQHVRAIAHLPVYIVQGQYDQVCPRFGADALAAALHAHGAKVDYAITCAGHASMDRETMLALTRIMERLPRLKH